MRGTAVCEESLDADLRRCEGHRSPREERGFYLFV